MADHDVGQHVGRRHVVDIEADLHAAGQIGRHDAALQLALERRRRTDRARQQAEDVDATRRFTASIRDLLAAIPVEARRAEDEMAARPARAARRRA